MNYKVNLTTKVNYKTIKKGSGIRVLEPDDYESSEVKAIKAKGYTVLGYISVGTIEKERWWFKTYKKFAMKKLKDWPNEYFADLTEADWRAFILKRSKAILAKGFDGLWADNIDIYEYYKSKTMLDALKKTLKNMKNLGGYLMVNGGSVFLNATDMSGIIDAYNQEEVFSRITSYSGNGKFGKQSKTDSAYYQKTIAKCMKKGMQCFLLEYTKDNDVKTTIKKYYLEKKCMGYYISSKVNL